MTVKIHKGLYKLRLRGNILGSPHSHGVMSPLDGRDRLRSLKSDLVPSLPRLLGESDKVLVKPGNGLVEGLLLGPLLDLDLGVTADGKTVLRERVLATT